MFSKELRRNWASGRQKRVAEDVGGEQDVEGLEAMFGVVLRFEVVV